jgi:dTDP-glucose 4,6-dehydratase
VANLPSSILVTGGAGFIGSALVRMLNETTDARVVTLDKLTYAGHRENLAGLAHPERHTFVHGDVCDRALCAAILAEHRVEAVLHLAAESHVDRSIVGADAFVETNIVGTHRLVEAARAHLSALPAEGRARFRFVHVSTDEVYGSLAPNELPFIEESRVRPNSPYAASKAAADHLVRAAHRTHGFPAILTNCSNNYGPRQMPEKLIPVVIERALARMSIPIYGDGLQVRDWIHVDDHCRALLRVLEAGRAGEVYNIGGNCQRTNLALVRALCEALDRERPRSDGVRHAAQIEHVADRPGHDRRYAISSAKLAHELGWRATTPFEQGLADTVRWYLANGAWLAAVSSAEHGAFMARQYGPRGA